MASIARIFRYRGSLTKLVKMSNAGISTSLKLDEKALEDLKNNPYYEKYSDKISLLQKVSPEEFKSRLETNQERKKPKDTKKVENERGYSVASQTSKPARLQVDPLLTKTKKLDDIMKTELLEEKSGQEIEKLWLDYHRNKDVVVGVVPKQTYAVISERGKEFPTFVLPIPRSKGYEFIMCQFSADEVHFTPLIAYQTHKENAPECLTLTYYPDLQDKKGIVLMKGEYDTDILNCQEAQCLANELQLYYAQNNEKRLKLLQRFTYAPNEFNHMDLIAELETLSL